MAASSSTLLSSSPLLLQGRNLGHHCQNQKLLFAQDHKRRVCFRVQAVKPPAGVEFPKVEPQFRAPFLGFTKTAEIWNTRSCMIGIIGIFIVELVIGVDVGKGLDLPL